MSGQTLQNLHFRWEVGQSISAIFLRRRLWGWICVASLAFTSFAGLETLLQSTSTTKTVLAEYPVNMTAAIADALPAGFSGVIAATGHDSFGTVYLTAPFVQVLRNYTTKSPTYLEPDGCASTSNVSCATTLTGVGFQYNCNAGRSGLLEPLSSDNGVAVQPNNTVFQVSSPGGYWSIRLDTLWQDKPGYTGLFVANQSCILIPALVEYPINVTQRTVALQSPTSTIDWTSDSVRI